MIRIESVNGKNVWELLKLQVSEDQRGFSETGEMDGDEVIAVLRL